MGIKSLTMIKNSLLLLSEVLNINAARIVLELIRTLLGVASSLIARVFIVRIIIDSITQELSFSRIAAIISVTALVEALYFCFNGWMMEYYRPLSNNKLHRAFQSRLYSRLSKMDIECYDNSAFYDKYILAVKESDTRAIHILQDMNNFLGLVIEIIITGGLIILGAPLLLAITIIPAIFFGWFGSIDAKIRLDYNNDVITDERRRDYVKRVVYLEHYAKEIRSTFIASILFSKFNKSITNILNRLKKSALKLTLINFIYMTLFYFQYIGIIAYLAWLAVNPSSITIGEFAMLLGAAGMLSSNWRSIGDYFGVLVEHGLFAQNYINFLKSKRKIIADNPSVELPTSVDLLSIKNLSFGYDNESNVLNNITLGIPEGKKIAIVGANGAGKSTLINLLLRLYDPVDGSITLNGTNIRHFDPDEYRQLFGVVFQDFQGYAATIAENVLLRSPITEEDETQVANALKTTNLYNKVKTLPSGIHTQLTKEFDEHGAIFSRGELQKLAIARSIAHNPAVLIMDEPSSALDPIAEQEMNAAVAAAMEYRTVIIISHRLSTVKDADKIYVIADGSIAECGNHIALLNKEGIYARMFNLQASQYQEV